MQRSWIPLALLVALVPSVAAPGGRATKSARTGRQIAFVRQARTGPFRQQLFVMNADGSRQRQLTRSRGWIEGYAWSPRGDRLVFAKHVWGKGAQIYRINSDGTGLRRLTKAGLYGAGPSWSPNARTIAFTGWVPGKRRAHVYVMRPDGSDPRRLDRLPRYNGVDEATWSPDGRRLAFGGGAGLFAINADGSGQRRLGRRAGYFLAWSPDGTRIGFVKMPGGYDSIYVVGLDGAPERLVTRHAYTESDFGWRPDGRGIVYARERRGGVYSIDVNGTHDHRLTRNSVRQDLSVGGFSWSPNGRLLAYASDVTGRGDIYVMSPDGRNQQRLTTSSTIEGAPTWQPER